MTPDRFIAAAFREICEDSHSFTYRLVMDRAAKLARESGDNEALPALPVPEWPAQEEWVDGLTTYPAQEDDLYTADQMRAYAHDAITAWKTRAAGDGNE
jgi:hypothetical protein